MTKLTAEEIATWTRAHGPWREQENALVREYAFADFAAALAFVVEIGAVAQAKDHHPDVALGWGKVKLSWSTHDAGGISARDRELAEESDRRYRT
jgi:4a-hydroxytetrahydrobiopterin dehydratase